MIALHGVGGASLLGVTATWGPGIHTIWGSNAQAGSELVRWIGGVGTPPRGRVRVDGADPYRSPPLRTRIGSLQEVEALPQIDPTVAALFQRLDRLRGGRTLERRPTPASTILEALDASFLLEQRPSQLSQPHARTVALAIALATPSPLALALFEPLSLPVPAARVLALLDERADAETCIFVWTRNLSDARKLGGPRQQLQHGRLVDESSPSPRSSDQEQELGLELHLSEPRRLLQLLSAEPAVAGLSWNERRSPHCLLVEGADPAQVATTIWSLAKRDGIDVRAMRLQARSATSPNAASARVTPVSRSPSPSRHASRSPFGEPTAPSAPPASSGEAPRPSSGNARQDAAATHIVPTAHSPSPLPGSEQSPPPDPTVLELVLPARGEAPDAAAPKTQDADDEPTPSEIQNDDSGDRSS